MRLESVERVLNHAFEEYQTDGLSAVLILTIDKEHRFTTSWATDDETYYLTMLGFMEQAKFEFMTAKEEQDNK
jgi:hypothetical protein